MKILVIHATAGAGHFKAADAVYQRLITRHPSHQSTIVDALDYAPSYFKPLYRGTYTFLISHIPWLWGGIFSFLDWRWVRPLMKAFRRVYNRLNTTQLHRFLMQEQFDYVISTHFMPIEVVAALKRKGMLKSKLISVVTDYDVHQIWLADEVDYYAVATDWTKEKMKQLGVPAEKVFVTGIPTHEKFSVPLDQYQAKKYLGLRPEDFTVLIATGSFGIGPIEEILQRLEGFQAIVICGHNKKLFESLQRYQSDRIKIFGLVDNMDVMMATADVMVTKPGGLSISEALVRHLPLVFFNAIPGQETGNVRVLKNHGIGLSPSSIQGIVDELKKMRTSPQYFQDLRQKTIQLAKPTAAEQIIRLLQ